MTLQRWVPRWGQLTSWEPFSDLADIQQEMNRLFDTFFGKARSGVLTDGGGWAPALDVYETKDDLVVRAELPGIDMNQVHITVVGDSLTIKGERPRDQEVKQENYYFMERRAGAFSRTLALPVKVQVDKVKATYKDGILEVRMPKVEEIKPKEIPIEVG